ncbi:methylated-DNA-[protein]-cysteine S-methyltransferase [Arboricoccus pini]|uniref:Methylated-DNA--protein-cysteine methyltransferase n=1 Tax=Arboricoccus pini TaxID=1963835 RepID=A0A212RDG2_9PROT|nr:methylated-DNA--[protein]-cysteine S-methyltransferase [Arboricoccus pini]SNB70324.1 methylated-DNA-[protein]-cysteine S-methyltransferase [Arboricoccus pini]
MNGSAALLSLTIDRLATPIGVALLVVDANGALCALDWEDYEDRMRRLLGRFHGAVRLIEGEATAARALLARYFAGELVALDAIAIRTLGGTPFQRGVWTALRAIPAGTVTSYGALALSLEAPGAMRAVGMANGSNPIGVVVPCHRVIGANGTLTGYGGGLERKRWLLQHEGALRHSTPRLL